MNNTNSDYVTFIAPGQWRIGTTRVSLDSVVHAYWSGYSPEATVEDFPTLTLEQVHGALAWYLHNQSEVDKAMQEREKDWQKLRLESAAKNGPLIQKIRQRAAQASGTMA